MTKKIILSLCAILFSTMVCHAQAGIEISLKNNSERELKRKSQLERVLKQYNPSKWIFTRKILIDEKTAIPHSHPVLTINTDQLDDDFVLLSTFVHEQIHWHEEERAQQRDRAIEELKALYPDAPGGPPEGARDRYSTYLHLIVCHLEYEAMKELVGNDKAKEIIEATSKRYYRWVYRTVLSDGAKLKAVVDKHKLSI